MKKQSRGMLTITMVLILSFVAVITLLVVLSLTVLEAKRSVLTENSSKAFYAAEGGFYSTLKRVREDPDADINDEITIGETEVRLIYNLGVGITVNSNNGGSQRRIVAEKESGVLVGERRPLDLVFVLDVSGSMGTSVNDTGSPIDEMKNALKDILVEGVGDIFVDGDRIALVQFSSLDPALDQTKVIFPEEGRTEGPADVLSNLDKFESIIDNLKAEGGTNTEASLLYTKKLLEISRGKVDYETRNPRQIILLFSDGIPSQMVNNEYDLEGYPVDSVNNGAGDFQCKSETPENSLLPIDDGLGGGVEGTYVGNPATDVIIKLANDIKDFQEEDEDQIKIYSIFLSNVNCSTCGPYPEFPFDNPTTRYYADPTWSGLGYSLQMICNINKDDSCDWGETCDGVRKNKVEEIETTVDFGRLLMKQIASEGDNYFRITANASSLREEFNKMIEDIQESRYIYREVEPDMNVIYF